MTVTCHPPHRSVRKTGENRKTGKPENRKTGKPGSDKYIQNGVYAGAPIPSTSPVGGTKIYDVALSDGDPDDDGGYLITATAASGTLLDGDDCETMTINALGDRTPDDAKCWRQ